MNYRRALAVSSAAVVVFALLLGLLLANDREAPVNAVAVQTINNINVAEVAAVAVNNRSGAYGLMIAPDGTVNLVAEPEIAGAQYSQEEMQAFIYMLSKLTASQTIEALATPASLADFGLEQPQANIALILKDGRTLRFRLGDASPVGDTYYFQKEGEPRVFLIGKLTGELMLHARTDYWDRQLLPRIDAQSIDRLKSVSLASAKNPRQSWRLDHQGASAFQLVEPVEAAVKADKIYSQLLLPCSAFRPQKFVALASDLAAYGLDHPEYVLTVEFDGQSYQLLFSADGNGGYYVAKAGSPAVFSVAAEKAEFLAIGYRDLLGDYLYNGSMAALASVEINRADEKVTVSLLGDGQQLYGVIDGVSIPHAQLSAALAPLYGIGIVGEVTVDENAQAEVEQALQRSPLATMTIKRRDGKTDVLEFYAKDETLSFVRSNGKVYFTAYSRAADAIEQALEQASSSLRRD